MEASQSSAPQSRYLRPEEAVALLERWLGARKCRPSDGLRALFAEIGRIGREYSSDRHEISSRFLFFAAAEASPSSQYDDRERAALEILQILSNRSDPSYAAQRQDYFAKRKGSAAGASPVFTLNIERLLTSALVRARERQPSDPVVTVDDLLRDFPPEGSKAEGLIAKLGIDPMSWRQRFEVPAERSSAAGEAGETGEPPPEAADPEPEDAGPESAPPSVNDSVATHADEPALIDQLERGPFAAVLARNIIEARASGESKATAFIVHLHGPWGAGKSSVLNFLEAKLRAAKEPWLVVRFNAWRDQRRQPPWWSLITCIYAGARKNLDRRTSDRLWWRWFKWRVRADFMPWAVSAALVLVCVALLVLGVTSSIGPAVSAIGTALTLLGAGAVAVRSLALGSQRAAQTYAELKADPFQPMTTLFDRLIAEIERPVAVFIDDLDRCDSSYVVELLEGVQTLMRSAPVTYVVAADRKWICSSFEQKYAKFSPPIGEPGRPLGYLFLDKLFQVSAAVPQLAADVRTTYWQSLLKVSRQEAGSGAADAEAERKAVEEARRAADAKARAELAGLTTHEQLASAVERSVESEDPIAIQATRAEAAMIITSAAASAQAEHRLKDYAHLLEPNPRAMKRLVNAYGMHQATLFLAGRAASPDALARWTILELRWPLLADFLATRPNYVDRVRKPLADNELKQVPTALRELFGDELVVEVVGEEAAEQRLNPDELRAILGAVQGDR